MWRRGKLDFNRGTGVSKCFFEKSIDKNAAPKENDGFILTGHLIEKKKKDFRAFLIVVVVVIMLSNTFIAG